MRDAVSADVFHYTLPISFAVSSFISFEMAAQPHTHTQTQWQRKQPDLLLGLAQIFMVDFFVISIFALMDSAFNNVSSERYRACIRHFQ